MTAKVLRAQGLPFSARRQDLEKFFEGYGLSGRMHLQADAYDKPTGIAFVEFASEVEAKRAKAERNMQHLGSRYIELLDARHGDLDHLTSNQGRPVMANVLRAQGLPFSASRQDLEKFFTGYGLSGRQHIQTDAFGQPTGIAFVEFTSEGEAKRAKSELNMQHMGSRYIELQDARDRDLDYLSGSLGSGRPVTSQALRVQGIPFSASRQDLEQFFDGYGLSGRMQLQKDPFGQPTGIAFVEFTSEGEAKRAKAELNMQHMGSRYIQLQDARDRDLDMCFGGGKEGMGEGMLDFLQALMAGWGGKGGGTGGKGGGWGGGGGGWDKGRAPTGKVLRVQGIPFSSTRQDLQQFFTGYGLSGRVHIAVDAAGQPSGIAFVEFASEGEAKRAFSQKNFQYMGARYIELMEAREQDVQQHFGGGGYGATKGGFSARAFPY